MNAIEEAGAAYAEACRVFDGAEFVAFWDEKRRDRLATNGVVTHTEREWIAFVNAAKKRDAALRDLIAAVEQAEEQA